MDPRPTDHTDDLIRRFSAGDRSPELLAALDRAAFKHFHAPWEKPPGPSPATPLLTPPSVEADEGPEGDEEEPKGAEPALDLLLAALLKQGCHPFIQDGPEVVAELPKDPGADFQIRASFSLRTGAARMYVRALADLLHAPTADARLREFCTAWNQSQRRLRADPFRHHPQGRTRMVVSGSISMPKPDRPQVFQAALRTLLGDINRFWWKAFLELEPPRG